ncbi:hypothetical protein D1007_07470 [Hordeum vulgare]|nr:hypothetical protein D1007_07470 [Hordeum vulgare]
MEQFQDGHHVRLRSRERGTYLHADEDGRGVSLRRPRASMNAAWAVHLYDGANNAQYVLLHSAAYGRYLAAMDAPAPPGHRGRRVEQRNYEEREEEAVRWEPVRFGTGDYTLLRHVTGRFLRANGKYLPWNNGASVDDFDSVSRMTHWVVERIAATEGMPELPLAGSLDALLPRRWIVYASVDHTVWAALDFKGRSVFRLRGELASQMGINDASNLVMCVQAGTSGRPTPLVVNLPRGSRTLHIVVVMAGEPGPDNLALRYPDVSAE